MVASLIGGLMSQGANSAAGSASSAAGAQALSNSYDIGNRDVARLSPWQASGAAAAQQVNALLGLGTLGSIGDQYNTYGTFASPTAQADAAAKFQTDPGYQFRLQQGVNALSRGASARGMSLSGAQAKGLNDYGQGMGSAEYGNYFNRLMGVSSLGENAAAGQNASYNQALVPGISQNFQGQQAQGAYNVAGTNALASGLKGFENSVASGIGALPGLSAGYNAMFA